MESPIRAKRDILESVPRPTKRRCGHFKVERDAEAQSAFDPSSDFSMVEKRMFEEEQTCIPAYDYMRRQRHITCKMRETLINSLVDIHNRFQLTWRTLFLSIRFCDRYLARISVTESELQLIGLTSMLVAWKFEEVEPPDVQALLECVNRNYTREAISSLECVFLKALDFRLSCSTVDNFLERLRAPSQIDEAQYDMVRYFVEVTASKIQFLSYAPSHIAAAAMLLSNRVMNRPAWPDEIASIARYSESSLEACVFELQSCVDAAQTDPLHASRRKYRTMKHYVIWSVKLEEFQRTRHANTSPGKLKANRTVLKESPPKNSPPPKPCASSTAMVNRRDCCPSQCVEELCRRHKCPESRINLHRQAFEGIRLNSVSKLKDMCRARRVGCTGTKEELALRLIDAMFH
mmetsp:Transcript_108395/g.171013  ORF Transcript_108395/g.171013 Transcript_108395/m.171013 type:complete len:405 (+) Transcript_108395:60-1274(+)